MMVSVARYIFVFVFLLILWLKAEVVEIKPIGLELDIPDGWYTMEGHPHEDFSDKVYRLYDSEGNLMSGIIFAASEFPFATDPLQYMDSHFGFPQFIIEVQHHRIGAHAERYFAKIFSSAKEYYDLSSFRIRSDMRANTAYPKKGVRHDRAALIIFDYEDYTVVIHFMESMLREELQTNPFTFEDLVESLTWKRPE